MRKLIIFILSAVMSMSIALPAFAADYNFEGGGDLRTVLGKPTNTDEPVPHNSDAENTRRNKDAADMPPPYGVFSGDFPTDPVRMSISGVDDASYSAAYPAYIFAAEPLYYSDGSIGTLSIPRFSLTMRAYEGETTQNMRKGAAHFTSTGAWNGNVCFAGHNRGSSAYFKNIKNLAIGDTIIYTTLYGTRSYRVFYKEKVNEADTSCLSWTEENIITLITCVENVPNLRWVVQACEVK